MQIDHDSILKGRCAEIFAVLCEESDKLGVGVSLPSIRMIQKRFAVGQGTAMKVSQAIAKRYGIEKQERTKMRKTAKSKGAGAYRETILVMCKENYGTWSPIVSDYNAANKYKIVPRIVDTYKDCVEMITRGEGDFVLFQVNPFSVGLMETSLPLLNLKSLVSELTRSEFYPAAFLTDPENRLFAIAPTLNTMILCCNPKFGRFDHNECCWEKMKDQFCTMKKTHPELDYTCVLDGYISFLFSSGINMVDERTKRVRLSCEELQRPLQYIKELLDSRHLPLFSDVYLQHWDRCRLFESERVATCQAFHSQSHRWPGYQIIPSPGDVSAKRCVSSELFSIYSGSLNYEIAWDFIKFSLLPETQLKLAEHLMPARRNLKPLNMSEELFASFAAATEFSMPRLEDYFFHMNARLQLQVGLDLWFRHGGKLQDILEDLEKTCQLTVDNAFNEKR